MNSVNRPTQTDKIAAVDLPFYLPRRVDKNSGGGCLDTRNQKEVSGTTKEYGEALITVPNLPGMAFYDPDRENQMSDEPPSPTLHRRLTNIVAAYVQRNQIEADQLPVLISTMHQALFGPGKPVTETEIERAPAVPIRQSVHRGFVFAWNAVGAARCSDGISRPAMN